MFFMSEFKNIKNLEILINMNDFNFLAYYYIHINIFGLFLIALLNFNVILIYYTQFYSFSLIIG